jgi:hypothetical protein
VRFARTAALCLALGACKPTPPSADATRDALVTLAALAYGAALEASPEDAQALGHYGLLTPALGDGHAFPLRREVMDHVRTWPAAERRRALAFFRAHPSYGTLYSALAVESFGPPPAFEPRSRGVSTRHNAPDLYDARDALSELYRWAYGPGRTRELAAAVAPTWAKIQIPAEEVEARKAAVLGYLGFHEARPLPRFSVVYDPLLAELTGYGAEPEDGEVLLIVGAVEDDKDRAMLLVHEFTHLPLSRILDRPEVSAAVERASCADAKIADHRSYDGFRNYVSENLVRSLSYRIGRTGPRDSGFLFEPLFAEMLPRYERLPARDFAAWAPVLFDEIAARFCN